MKRYSYILIVLLTVLCCFPVCGQQQGEKKVAVLLPIDRQGNVNYFLKAMVRGKLTNAVVSMSGYGVYERTDIDAIFEEQAFQRTGHVSDEQKQKMGEIKGVAYVLVSEISQSGKDVYIQAKLMKVETSGVEKFSDQLCSENPEQMEKGCLELVRKLFGQGGTYSNSGGGSVSGSGSQGSGTNYTETAFGINMQMIRVEGGTFMMGCTSEQSDCDDDEKNVRRVTLDGYYIGQCEVTQEQWEKVMGTSIYQQKNKWGEEKLYGVGPNNPMYYVSWEEATAFCEELSRRTGKKYRLPTEAQWEYAARGGNKNEGTRFSGSSLMDAVAWHGGNSGGNTHPVGTKRSNILGLYDMSGNVWEWCRDWYSDTYNSLDTQNPKGPQSGTERVIRGGSVGDWIILAAIAAKIYTIDLKISMEAMAEEVAKGLTKEDAEDLEEFCRVAERSAFEPNTEDLCLGFRVVCEP